MNYLALKSQLSQTQQDNLDELENYFESHDELLYALRNPEDSDKLQTAINEIAESRVPIYNSDLFEWASKNVDKVYEFESESGQTDALDRVRFACFMTEQENLNNTIKAFRE